MRRTVIFLFFILLCRAHGADEYDYSSIDRYVEAAPVSAASSVEGLAAYLVMPAKNDREKVRAIYYWIARNVVYDAKTLSDFLYNGLPASQLGDDAETVLKNRKGVCGEMANLFNVMARSVGLKSEFVLGWVKGFNSLYGKAAENKFGDKPNHAWNRVMIDGRWHLLDLAATVGWGGKMEMSPDYLKKRKVTAEDMLKDLLSGKIKYTPEMRTHFFLTPPEILIETHLPVDKQWQLLDEPLSKEKFERRVFLMPPYFDNGLELLGPKEFHVIRGRSFDITLKNPRLMPVYAASFYDDNYADYSVFMPKLSGDTVTIPCSFGKKGPYKLFVFTQNAKFSGGQPEAAIMYLVTVK